MPTFNDRVPSNATRFQLTLIRCQQGGTIRAVITSPRIVGLYTHYFGGRTCPCVDVQCKACSEGFSARWHGYFGVWLAGKPQHKILELTANPCLAIQSYQDTYGTTRGALITVKRVGARQNGRVECVCEPCNRDKLSLPDEPNLINALATLWSLPTSAFIEQTAAQTGNAEQTVSGQRAALAFNPADGNGHHGLTD